MTISVDTLVNTRKNLVTVFSAYASEPKPNRQMMIEAHGIACDIADIDDALARAGMTHLVTA